MADAQALKRALGNLIDNAAEAMENTFFACSPYALGATKPSHGRTGSLRHRPWPHR